MMKYCLMHKNIPVLDFILDDATCSILKIGEIHRIEHLPVGLPVTKGHPDRASLNEWWKGRAIPLSRQGIRQALQELEVSHEEQIRLVTDFDWIDWDALKGIELQFAELVADSPFIDAARCDAICHAIRKRVEMLQKIALMSKGRGFAVSCANDVRQDQAYSGNEQ